MSKVNEFYSAAHLGFSSYMYIYRIKKSTNEKIVHIKQKMERIFLMIFLMLTTVLTYAQTQYDYYDDYAYTGVDTAIKGFKILGIVVLIAAVVVIIGGVWAKMADWFNPSKKDAIPQKQVLETKPAEIEKKQTKTYGHAIITITGSLVNAIVTMQDGSKKYVEIKDGSFESGVFLYDIKSIIYNFKEDITDKIGNAKVSEFLINMECPINRESIEYVKLEEYKEHIIFYFFGDFNPKKIQFSSIDGLDIYDSFLFFYDGKAMKLSAVTEDYAAEIVAHSIK